MRQLRLVARISIGLAIAACDSTAPSRVVVMTTASPTTVRAAESTTITVSVTNISRRVILVPSPQSMCGHVFKVFDMSGREAQLPPSVCALVLVPPMELEPGETVSYNEAWTPSSAKFDGQPLGPGNYEVRPIDFRDLTVATAAFASLVVEP